MAGRDPFEGLSPQERQTVVDNIVTAEATLDSLIADIHQHLIRTRNACPLACIGQPAQFIHELDPGAQEILLVQALRRLASIEWEKGQ
jgi:hypothetical protein